MAEELDGVSEFYKELDLIGFQMPGSGGKLVSFSDDKALLHMVSHQYPRWKEDGRVTSVPIARIPKMFLNHLQTTKTYHKTFKYTLKGDGAEKELYNLFMGGNFAGQPGTIIFPNFDASEMFGTQVAKVEIDMVLVHQNYGIFVFNVKKEGGKSTSSEGIKDDRNKHNNLIRMLMNYKRCQEFRDIIPIHTIMCDFEKSTRKFKDLEQDTCSDVEKTLVFNKEELKSPTFVVNWVRKLEQAGLEEISWTPQMDVLVARLIALSSAESTLALIHEQMEGGFLQTVSNPQYLKTQIQAIKSDEIFEEVVVGLSEVIVQHRKEMQSLTKNDHAPETQVHLDNNEFDKQNSKTPSENFSHKEEVDGRDTETTEISYPHVENPDLHQSNPSGSANSLKMFNPKKERSRREKKKFILWTLDQLQVLDKVYNHLSNRSGKSPRKGLRLIVAGCKGSGKTLLLTFIAKLSQSIIKPDTEGETFKVLVCDGGFNSHFLLSRLQQALKFKDVDVFTISTPFIDFHLDRAVEEENLRNMRKEFAARLKGVDLMLCDEYIQMKKQLLLSSLQENQHCVLFTSIKDSKRWPEEFEVMNLTYSLRSTNKLTTFANNWIKIGGLTKFDYDCRGAHNFEGESLDIRIINKNDVELDDDLYITECVATISEYAQKSIGLSIVPVLPFLDLNVRDSIVERLKAKNYKCQYSSDDNLSKVWEQINNDETSTTWPTIVFFEETIDLEGGEFGVVIILIYFRHVKDIPSSMKSKFFCAITRASVKQVILINGAQLRKCRDINYGTTTYERECCLQKEVNEKFESLLEKISLTQNARPTILLVGKKPNMTILKQAADHDSIVLPDIEGISLYVGETSCFLYIEDVFKEADLNKLHNFGIQYISLTLECVTCVWQNAFFKGSMNLIVRYAMNNRNAFLFRGTGFSGRENDLLSIVRYCALHSNSSFSFDIPTISMETFKKAPLPSSDSYSWHKWVEKGNSHYQVGQKGNAAYVYKLSCLILEKQYVLETSAGNLVSAKVTRAELAKIHVRVAEIYLELAKDLSSDDKIFGSSNHSYEFFIIETLSHTLEAVAWNICWEPAYEVFQNILENIRSQYEMKRLKFKGKKDVDKYGKTDEKVLNDDQQIWKEPTMPIPDDCSELQEKLTTFLSLIENYKRLPTSNNTINHMNAAKKEVSELGIFLSQETLERIRDLSDGEEKNVESAKKLIKIAQAILEYPMRLAFESILWDFHNAEVYSIVLSAATKLERIITRLKSNSEVIAEEAHFIETI